SPSLVLRELRALALRRLQCTRDVRLAAQVRLGGLAFANTLADVLEAYRRCLTPRECLALQPAGAVFGELTGRAVVLGDAHGLSGVGHAVEAEDLDGLAWTSLCDTLPHEVV